MNRLFKRELLFLGGFAVLAGVYIYIGLRLAPPVPPEPESLSGQVSTIEQFVANQKLVKQRNEAIEKHNQFLQSWAQWGAGIGAALVIIYTLWRPPWYVRMARAEPSGKTRKAEPSSAKRKTGPAVFGGRISPKALLMMTATVVLLIVMVVLLVAVLS